MTEQDRKRAMGFISEYLLLRHKYGFTDKQVEGNFMYALKLLPTADSFDMDISHKISITLPELKGEDKI